MQEIDQLVQLERKYQNLKNLQESRQSIQSIRQSQDLIQKDFQASKINKEKTNYQNTLLNNWNNTGSKIFSAQQQDKLNKEGFNINQLDSLNKIQYLENKNNNLDQLQKKIQIKDLVDKQNLGILSRNQQSYILEKKNSLQNELQIVEDEDLVVMAQSQEIGKTLSDKNRKGQSYLINSQHFSQILKNEIVQSQLNIDEKYKEQEKIIGVLNNHQNEKKTSLQKNEWEENQIKLANKSLEQCQIDYKVIMNCADWFYCYVFKGFMNKHLKNYDMLNSYVQKFFGGKQIPHDINLREQNCYIENQAVLNPDVQNLTYILKQKTKFFSYHYDYVNYNAYYYAIPGGYNIFNNIVYYLIFMYRRLLDPDNDSNAYEKDSLLVKNKEIQIIYSKLFCKDISQQLLKEKYAYSYR
ncbi:hypothetical protein PPERSA_11434 [Pseudocohnilembus persalinus]|uniref:Uncharacterized protein n=1 Tax=Pseudocohnilembus persalinus TaxID=266149 RepID=A0A0V0QY39_PSEPJ|nr:hypothetical protein PPERSA_11434 [Pseudocohnilembus persalinus]|eukprot:KRX06789.1 hypothetical protein PPERSA_11434 [Pseudocohnilembus persalinus]